jgi:hypothetical protein
MAEIRLDGIVPAVEFVLVVLAEHAKAADGWDIDAQPFAADAGRVKELLGQQRLPHAAIARQARDNALGDPVRDNPFPLLWLASELANVDGLNSEASSEAGLASGCVASRHSSLAKGRWLASAMSVPHLPMARRHFSSEQGVAAAFALEQAALSDRSRQARFRLRRS